MANLGTISEGAVFVATRYSLELMYVNAINSTDLI